MAHFYQILAHSIIPCPIRGSRCQNVRYNAFKIQLTSPHLTDKVANEVKSVSNKKKNCSEAESMKNRQ